MTFIVCYTNGSCKNNNRQRYGSDERMFTSGAGIFIPQSFRFKHRVENQSIPIRQKTLCKNNAANLLAIRESLKTAYLLDVKRVHIYTSSKYAINGLTEHCERWVENGWLNRKGEPLVNQELWKEIFDLRNKIPNCEFIFMDYDRANVNYGMQEAARLAKQASKLWGFPAKRQFYPEDSPANSRNNSPDNSPARSH